MGKVDGIVVRHQVNDLVVYGSNGVFRIDGVCKKKIDGRETEYYVLKPVYEMACPPLTCRWRTNS